MKLASALAVAFTIFAGQLGIAQEAQPAPYAKYMQNIQSLSASAQELEMLKTLGEDAHNSSAGSEIANLSQIIQVTLAALAEVDTPHAKNLTEILKKTQSSKLSKTGKEIDFLSKASRDAIKYANKDALWLTNTNDPAAQPQEALKARGAR